MDGSSKTDLFDSFVEFVNNEKAGREGRKYSKSLALKKDFIIQAVCAGYSVPVVAEFLIRGDSEFENIEKKTLVGRIYSFLRSPRIKADIKKLKNKE